MERSRALQWYAEREQELRDREKEFLETACEIVDIALGAMRRSRLANDNDVVVGERR